MANKVDTFRFKSTIGIVLSCLGLYGFAVLLVHLAFLYSETILPFFYFPLALVMAFASSLILTFYFFLKGDRD